MVVPIGTALSLRSRINLSKQLKYKSFFSIGIVMLDSKLSLRLKVDKLIFRQVLFPFHIMANTTNYACIPDTIYPNYCPLHSYPLVVLHAYTTVP